MSAVQENATFPLVVASNRLPVAISRGSDGLETKQLSPGGLVTAMEPALTGMSAAWVGWLGGSASRAPFHLAGDTTFIPVAITVEDVENHYEGYSNSMLWPLFHDVGVAESYEPHWWASYEVVNHTFATALCDSVEVGGVVWVHDYHLMVTPALVREGRADVAIGYYHHIPFPPPAVLERSRHAGAIVRGLLGADLVGFQRHSDVVNFLACVTAFVPGALVEGSQVHLGEGENRRTLGVAAHPISLDFVAIDSMASSAEVQAMAIDFRGRWGNPTTVFLGVDRIDYTKGIPERLLAFEDALARGALSANDVVFVQAGSPSRDSVAEYQRLGREIAGLVERINTRFPGPDGRPAVIYVAENLPREAMIALYVAADVMVVTSLRDGMNLVAKEFVAARGDDTGVLVLSEFTGAADQLTEAFIVDPTNPGTLRDALIASTTIGQGDASAAMRSMRAAVATHDVTAWCEGYLADLRARAKEG